MCSPLQCYRSIAYIKIIGPLEGWQKEKVYGKISSCSSALPKKVASSATRKRMRFSGAFVLAALIVVSVVVKAQGK